MRCCISPRTATAEALERCGSASALLNHHYCDECKECARKGRREEGEFVKDFWHGSLDTGAFLGDSCRILPTQGNSGTRSSNAPRGEKLRAAAHSTVLS